MLEILPTLLLAFALGWVTSSILRWRFSGARTMRASVLVLIPPLALFAVFLVFTRGAPQSEEWIWMGIGFVYFWPWYLAWSLGAGGDALLRTWRGRR